MQDNVAERLKSFKMRKFTQSETVTTASETQMNFFTPRNPKYSSASSVSSTPSSRPTSHHRRRSSVSTRRESAEMMGVSASALADLPSADDGDTNNTRRRALWALEGKRDDLSPTNYVGGFSKVEIPELSSSIERNNDNDNKNQPIYPINSALAKRDSLGRERDSYGRVISQALSLKDQLHTLLEEDEEEEAPQEPPQTTHSPAASSYASEPMPHSSSAPSSLTRNRLKPLTLSTSSPLVSTTIPLSRPLVPTLTEIAAKRRSSFSYRRSEDVNSSVSISSNSLQFIRNALPTPESTPTTSERPLSPSEQAFLFNNQASLLARISELERVLASRSRPLSLVSSSSRQLSTSSIASEPHSDEMLRLIQDLKTERDDLSRDLGVSQSKVENLESQITLLNRRIECERKETWIAKQTEQASKIENSKLSKELDGAKLQILRLKEELANVREELESRDVFHVHRKDVSMPHSVEQGSFPGDEGDEEDELAHYEDEDIGDVSFYSDQDGSTSSTSLNDRHQSNLLPPTTIRLHAAPSPSSAASISPPSTPLKAPVAVHQRSSSLEQGWTFPKGARPAAKTESPRIDRFFECLEILDNDDLTQSPFIPINDLLSQDKYGFFSGQQDMSEDEDDFPFMLPSQSFQGFSPSPKLNKLHVPAPKPIQLTPPLSPTTTSVVMPFHSEGDATKIQVTGLPSTPQRTPPVGKHVSPSLIPKPSPPRSDLCPSHLATPTSVPRVKISPVTPPSAIKSRDQRDHVKSPTKLPQLRMAANSTQLASSPSNGFQILKGTSMGFTALANYLPWTSWSGDDSNGKPRATKENGITVSTRNVQRPSISPNLVSITSKGAPGAKLVQKKTGKSDQLMLL